MQEIFMSEKSLYSPNIFVGRNKEIQLFTEMLNNSTEDSSWGLHIEAKGGMGKTQLLHKFMEISKDLPSGFTALITDDLIDLYHTIHQTELGILKAIADQFKQQFTKFYEEFLDYQAAPQDSTLSELKQTFIKCYQNLKANHIILVFDTTEEMSEGAKHFFHEMLPKLKKIQPETFIISAGRTPFPIDNIEDIKNPIINMPLEGLSCEEVKEYFSNDSISLQLSESTIKELTARSQGRPILIGLIVDSLKNNNYPEELLDCKSNEEFERMLVGGIQELDKEQNLVILALAHLYRHFDEKILAHIFDKTEKEAFDIIKNLSSFSFIKYRTSKHFDNSCLLHDEMRSLIKKYIWDSWDPNESFRIQWSEKVITYYDKLLASLDLELQDKSLSKASALTMELEKQSLIRERLYYQLFSDIEKGFESWLNLIKEHRDSAWEVRAAIIKELEHFEEQLPPMMKHELILHQSYILYDQAKYSDSNRLMQILWSDETCSQDKRAKALVKLIQAYTNSGRVEEAIELAEKNKDFFQKNIEEEPDDFKNKFYRQHGHFLNALGYAYRRQGQSKNAITHYRNALIAFSKLENDENEHSDNNINHASTKINLAFSLHLIGEDREAIFYCNSAIRGTTHQTIIGRAYNVLGIIDADSLRVWDASNHFNIALQEFEKSKYIRGKGLTWIALGRMHRQQGWHKAFSHENVDAAKDDYNKAHQYLTEAVELFENIEDTKESPDLAEAYTERGLLSREQGQYDEAISFLIRSKTLAEKCNNKYLVADNYQHLATTYYYQGNKKLAIEKAQKSLGINKSHFYHIHSRAERVIADIEFKEKNYQQAFYFALTSLINRIAVDPNSQDDSKPKKERLYNEWIKWIVNLFDELENQDLKKQYAQYMVDNFPEKKKQDYNDFVLYINEISGV